MGLFKNLPTNLEFFLTDFPIDHKTHPQGFAAMADNVLGGRVIPSVSLKNRISREGIPELGFLANVVWRKPWLHLLSVFNTGPLTSGSRQKGKKQLKPFLRLLLAPAQTLLP